MKNDVTGIYPKNKLRVSVDHKSTKGVKSISIQRESLQKCFKDASQIHAVGILTWSYFNKQDLYGALRLEDLLILLEDAAPETLAKLEGLNG